VPGTAGVSVFWRWNAHQPILESEPENDCTQARLRSKISIGGRMGILLSFVTFWSLPCDHTSDNRSVESPNSFRWMSYLSSSDRKRLHILRLGLSR